MRKMLVSCQLCSVGKNGLLPLCPGSGLFDRMIDVVIERNSSHFTADGYTGNPFKWLFLEAFNACFLTFRARNT